MDNQTNINANDRICTCCGLSKATEIGQEEFIDARGKWRFAWQLCVKCAEGAIRPRGSKASDSRLVMGDIMGDTGI